jgi:hypothetical protein
MAVVNQVMVDVFHVFARGTQTSTSTIPDPTSLIAQTASSTSSSPSPSMSTTQQPTSGPTSSPLLFFVGFRCCVHEFMVSNRPNCRSHRTILTSYKGLSWVLSIAFDIMHAIERYEMERTLILFIWRTCRLDHTVGGVRRSS